jgi:hypothetical protein
MTAAVGKAPRELISLAALAAGAAGGITLETKRPGAGTRVATGLGATAIGTAGMIACMRWDSVPGPFRGSSFSDAIEHVHKAIKDLDWNTKTRILFDVAAGIAVGGIVASLAGPWPHRHAQPRS